MTTATPDPLARTTPRATPTPAGVELLGTKGGSEVVSVLVEAFATYPVMRYVLGDAPDFVRRHEQLTSFFVMTRFLRGEPVLGVRDASGELLGAALVSMPGRIESPPQFALLRERTWSLLGEEARRRYEMFGAATERFDTALDQFDGRADHLHLNMIGVRRRAQGRGIGRRLLDAVHALSATDALSTGVSLTTEVASNVTLYRHVGYEVVGSADVDGAFTTRGMFRPDC